MASGIIQLTLLLVLGVLALLPFFERFSVDAPHQLAAIKQLEESMPPELLEEHDADWFQAWKESGYDQAGLHALLQAARQQDWNGLPRVLQLSSCHGGSVLQEGSYR